MDEDMAAYQLFGMAEFAICSPRAGLLILCISFLFLLLWGGSTERRICWTIIICDQPLEYHDELLALEINRVSACLLAELYFFILTLKKYLTFYLLPALMYDLRLNANAILRRVVPLVLALEILYVLIV